MKRVLLLAGIAGALVGCGSGLPTPPELKSFNYGAPTAPTPEQSSAASIGESGVRSAAGVNQTSNPQAAPGLPDQMAANFPSLGSALAPPSLEAALSRLPVPTAASAAQAVRSAGLSVGSNCTTVTDTSVTYKDCSTSSEGFALTLNGTISVSPGSIHWDISATASGNTQGISVDGKFIWTGQLTWTSATVQGQGRSAYGVRADANGQHVELAATAGVDVNLQVDATNHCISGGTLELRRVAEGHASNGQSISQAVGWKFTWNGCGNVTVANGT